MHLLKMGKGHRNKKINGFALVFVLAITTIAIGFSLFLVKLSREIVFNLQLFEEKVQSDFLLKSYLSELLFKLSNCKWTCNSCVTDSGKKYLMTGEKYLEKYPDYTVELSIRDSRSFLYLRNIPKEVVRNLFSNVGLKNAEVLTNSFLDWIDYDDIPRPNGAECNYYRLKGFAYCPRNNPALQSEFELIDIRGFSKEQVDKIADLFTLYSDGFYNINTLNPIIIESWPGLNKITAKEIISKRKQSCIKVSDIPNFNSLSYLDLIVTEPSKVLKIQLCCLYKHAKTCASCVVDFRHGVPEVLSFRYLH